MNTSPSLYGAVRVDGENGQFDITRGMSYPGVDIEYTLEGYDDIPQHVLWTKPRVLIEEQDGKIFVYVWSDKYNEDFTHKIECEI